MLPFIRDDFNLSYAESGLLVSAFSLSLGFSNAPLGILADRIGSRPVITAGLVLIGLASLALGLAGAYWQLLVLLILTGVIAGSYHAPAAALIARSFPSNVLGSAMGFHITGGHLSFFLVPAAAAAVVGLTATWRTPYLWFAFAPIVLGALVWQMAPRSHQRPPASAHRLAVFRDMWSVFQLVGPLVSLSLVFQMVYAALLAFTAVYLVDARGMAAELAAALFGFPQLVGVLGAPLAGRLSDRLGRRAVILTGVVGMGPSLLAMTLVPNELIVLPLLATGVFTALRQTTTETYVMEKAPAHRRATVLGGYHMLSQPLGGIAAPLFGALAGLVGIGTAFGGTCLTLALFSALVLLLQRQLPR